jgi:ABC-2 type transport system ATP-binding protein
MTALLEADGLSKHYGRHRALSDCDVTIPAGRVAGLVGPNGAGKTTLLQLAVGLREPTAGSIRVLGRRPAEDADQLARVGFVAQETPTYPSLTVAQHLAMGKALNPGWDPSLARSRIEDLGLDPRQKAGSLSGGQRAQLALTLAVAKRPELLILDEPVASLDPLARREFLQSLMETVADHHTGVVVSSHLISDLERVCDYLIVVVDSRVVLAGDVAEMVACHHLLTGPRRQATRLPADQAVIEESHTDRQTTVLVRSRGPILDPTWTAKPLSLEDLVLAYMRRGRAEAAGMANRKDLEVVA